MAEDTRNKKRKKMVTLITDSYRISRYYYDLVFEVSEEAVDLNRMANDNMPLLLNHIPDNLIGTWESMEVDASEGEVRGVVAFGSGKLADNAYQDIEDGILKGASPSIDPKKLMLVERNEEGNDLYRLTEYEIIEGSLTPIPANPETDVTDFSMEGIGMAGVKFVNDPQGVYADKLERLVQEYNHDDAGTVPVIKEEVVEMTMQNDAPDITKELGKLAKQYSMESLLPDAISEGLTVEQFQVKIIDAREESHKAEMEKINSINLPHQDAPHQKNLDKSIQNNGGRFNLSKSILHTASISGLTGFGSISDKKRANEIAAFEIQYGADQKEAFGNAVTRGLPVNGAFVPFDALVPDKYVVGVSGASEGIATSPVTPWEQATYVRTPIMRYVNVMNGLVDNEEIPTIGKVTGGYGADTAALTAPSDASVEGVTLQPKQASVQSEITMLSNIQSRGNHGAAVRTAVSEQIMDMDARTVEKGAATVGDQPSGILSNITDDAAHRGTATALSSVSSATVRELIFTALSLSNPINLADDPVFLASPAVFQRMADQPRLSGGRDVPALSDPTTIDSSLMRMFEGTPFLYSVQGSSASVAGNSTAVANFTGLTYGPAGKVHFGRWASAYMRFFVTEQTGQMRVQVIWWTDVKSNEYGKFVFARSA